MTSHFVRFDGRQLHVTEGDGIGPNVVFEAGGGCDAGEWQAVEALLGSVHTWSYDRAGEGMSSAPRRWSVASCVRDLEIWLDALDVAPPYILVGHSLGAHIVRTYAHQHPDKVASMVLVDPRVAGFEKEFDMPFEPDQPGAVHPLSVVQAEDRKLSSLTYPAAMRIVILYAEHFDIGPQESDDVNGRATARFHDIQRGLTSLSERADARMVAGSGHMIPITAPEAVANVIEELAQG